MHRFCIGTYGAAFVGTDTIIGLMDEFVVSVEADAPATDDDEISWKLASSSTIG